MAKLLGIGQYSTVDPNFTPVPFDQLPESTKKTLESNGRQFGLDARGYYEARGGLDASGYFGDSWRSTKNLTPAEYTAAVAKGGGAAVNAATEAKQASFAGPSQSPTSFTTTSTTQAEAEARAKAKAEAEARAAAEATAKADAKRAIGQSAWDFLFSEFSSYGMGSLVEPLKVFITEGLSPAELTLRLRETDGYKKRFAANQARIQKGLRALSEAEYVLEEDKYQEIMRRYGLPETYYARGEMGRQEGFEKLIGGDVSPIELEDRIQTAYNRVINAAPEVTASLRSFYPEINQGDLLAYFLDTDKAIQNIKRKVTAAEIGGAAAMSGLATSATRAEELARYGVTGEAAREGFQAISDTLPTAQKLSSIYAKQGIGPYTQTTAEQQTFGLAGATEAKKKLRKLTELETASFSGQAGAAGGALGRERAGQF